MSKQYWLIKSEPESYSVEHLKKDGTTAWTGVRNFQARNFMKDMHVGDEVLFYHSSCAVPGVYGLARVSAPAGPDQTQFDARGHYFEPRATKDKPVWECVDVEFVKALKNPVPLTALRAEPALAHMRLLAPGNRLSIMPVTPEEFACVKNMAL